MVLAEESWLRGGCSSSANSASTDLETKMVELEDRANSSKSDVIMIQESKLRATDPDPKLKGYTTIRKDRGVGRGGGLITFVKEDIPFTVVTHTEAVEGSLLEILLVDINLASLSKTMCANVYCPPTRGSQQGSELDTRELPYAENTIVGGDLNANSSLWDSWQPEYRLGGKVEDWLAEKNFSVANDGEATRVKVGTGGRSAPDVTLVHNSWLDKVEWGVMDCMGSDHLTILITLDIPTTTLKPTTSRMLRWNWSKADFKGFSNQVEMAVLVQKDSFGRASLDARMASLVVSITEAANSFIGKVKSSTNGKTWMPREIREAVKSRNSLRRSLGDNRREWVEACRSVQALIRKEKERRWVEFLEDAADTADPNKIWMVVKSLSGKSQGSTRNESLVHNGRLCTTSKAKADAFMQIYAEVSRLDIPKADRLNKYIRRQLKVPSVDGESSSGGTE